MNVYYNNMQTWQRIKNNSKLLNQYLMREKVIDIIRIFFKKQGFREVFTPIMVPIPSIEPNLEVFRTELKTSKGVSREGYLIMSPEFSIKKLLSAGVGSCFEITKCFRNNEEVSRLHNPEFTMLEWYRVDADYADVMKDA
jgi:elongation factor P--(R)-beta-lysine ligase